MEKDNRNKIDQNRILAVLQSAYQKGEKSVIDSPRELIQDMIMQLQASKSTK